MRRDWLVSPPPRSMQTSSALGTTPNFFDYRSPKPQSKGENLLLESVRVANAFSIESTVKESEMCNKPNLL